MNGYIVVTLDSIIAYINIKYLFPYISRGPPGPKASVRGKRMVSRPVAVNANRREYGKGLVGRWLNRTIKRKRLPSTVRKQLDNLSDHR